MGSLNHSFLFFFKSLYFHCSIPWPGKWLSMCGLMPSAADLSLHSHWSTKSMEGGTELDLQQTPGHETEEKTQWTTQYTGTCVMYSLINIYIMCCVYNMDYFVNKCTSKSFDVEVHLTFQGKRGQNHIYVCNVMCITQKEIQWAHNDTVLLVGLQADSGDIRDVGAAQGTEEACLAILMASQQLPVCDHQATWDTRGGGYALRDDLKTIQL